MKERGPRSRPVGMAEFRKLISAERKVAKALGFGIQIRYRKFSWQRVRDWGTYSNVCGLFCEKRKLIQLTVTGRPSRTKVLSALYHEMRHLEHYTLSLFNDYYRLTPDIVGMIVDHNEVPDGFKAPCLRTALLAERDCDRVSTKRLRKLGLNPKTKPYPLHNTLSFVVVSGLQSIYMTLVETVPYSAETLRIELILKELVSSLDRVLLKLKRYNGSNKASYCEMEAFKERIMCILQERHVVNVNK